jgi:3-oxoacyl-[acyl-carrier protein] reductase
VTVTIDLSGQTAVVTGAGSGIGRASAQLLAEAGAAVVCADRDASSAGETAKLIVDGGGRASVQVMDVTSSAEVDALVEAAVDQYGRLDIMANIAGIILQSPVIDLTDDDLDRILSVNLKGVVFGCRAAARVMRTQGSGAIINMSSAAIDAPASGLAGYGMAKAAVVQLTRVLAAELAPHGVRVNAVAPGYVVTNMTGRMYTDAAGAVDEEKRSSVLEAIRKSIPLRRVGEPDDIANAVLFLASEGARYMTGQILRPNGGVAMPW